MGKSNTEQLGAAARFFTEKQKAPEPVKQTAYGQRLLETAQANLAREKLEKEEATRLANARAEMAQQHAAATKAEDIRTKSITTSHKQGAGLGMGISAGSR